MYLIIDCANQHLSLSLSLLLLLRKWPFIVKEHFGHLCVFVGRGSAHYVPCSLSFVLHIIVTKL